MRERLSLSLCLLLAMSAVASAGSGSGGSRSDKILEFDTMVGVSVPFTGATNPIRGVNGGGVPWVIGEGSGELRVDGRLEIRVRGLIIPTRNPPGNPQANFRAIVSCLTTDAVGNAVTTNVVTEQFPATPDGNADIETEVMLPTPCIAPIVFVTSGAGTAWFAATGR
jgi:hypothetical protein